MKPARFAYHRPATLDEALALLRELDEPKALAGGQSLVPMLNLRMAQPTDLVDLGAIPGLDGIRATDDGGVAIGAMTRQRDVELSPLARDRVPALVALLRHVAHVTVRNRGTIGGSVAHADPSAELPLACRTLDAQLVVAGAGGQRVVPAADFFVTHLTTVLEPDELLVELRFPGHADAAGLGFEELTRRHGDFAVASALALVWRDPAGAVRAARVGVGAVHPVPVRVPAAEAELVGLTGALEDDRLERILAAVDAEVEPVTDIHAPAAYRRRVLRTLVATALRRALAEGATREGAAA